MDTHRIGRRFEDVAAAWLEARGWRIVERNVRFGRKEVDLVMRRGDLVVFVEVKGRRGGRYGHPLEAITPRKRHEIELVASWWLARAGDPALRCRFDAVAVTPGADGGVEIEHVEDAWRPGWR
jgi:putative endonuclease